MADSLKTLAVGDTFLAERVGRNSPASLTEYTVRKIGRKWLFATPSSYGERYSGTTKFHIDTGIEDASFMAMRAFLNQDSYAKELEHRNLQRNAGAAARSLNDFGCRLIERLGRDDLLAIIAIAERAKAGAA